MRNISNFKNTTTRISIWLNDCDIKIKNHYNNSTYTFHNNQRWNSDIGQRFIRLISKPYIKQVSILGGEPLADKNLKLTLHIMNLIGEVCEQCNKEIMVWIYTGYVFEDIYDLKNTQNNSPFNYILNWVSGKTSETFDESANEIIHKLTRNVILQCCDYLVDGQFELDKQDLTYSKVKFAGSTNQRIIDVQKTLEKGEIMLYE